MRGRTVAVVIESGCPCCEKTIVTSAVAAAEVFVT